MPNIHRTCVIDDRQGTSIKFLQVHAWDKYRIQRRKKILKYLSEHLLVQCLKQEIQYYVYAYKYVHKIWLSDHETLSYKDFP